MLDIKKIAAYDSSLTDAEWLAARVGHLSASEIGRLMSAKSHKGVFTKGAISYIQGKAGEVVTGKPAKEPFHNANTDWGNATEAEAIDFFCAEIGRPALRNSERGDTRFLIIQDEFLSATPDALVCDTTLERIFNAEKTHLKVSPLEIKCPPILHRFIKLYNCKTSADLKQTEPLYYYQVLSQMIFCESLTAFFACYHPDFPKKMGSIVFNKIDLVDEVKRVNQTLYYAKEEMKKLITILA